LAEQLVVVAHVGCGAEEGPLTRLVADASPHVGASATGIWQPQGEA
jgi:hypothetical protein